MCSPSTLFPFATEQTFVVEERALDFRPFEATDETTAVAVDFRPFQATDETTAVAVDTHPLEATDETTVVAELAAIALNKIAVKYHTHSMVIGQAVHVRCHRNSQPKLCFIAFKFY